MFSATRATSSPSVVSGRMLQTLGPDVESAAGTAPAANGAVPGDGADDRGDLAAGDLAAGDLDVFGVLAMAVLPAVAAWDAILVETAQESSLAMVPMAGISTSQPRVSRRKSAMPRAAASFM